MRIILFFLLGQLAACGASKDDAPTVAPEVTRISLDGQPSCFESSGCSLSLAPSCSGADTMCPPSGYKFVVAMAEGDAAPAACDGASISASYNIVLFQRLKAATKYSFRGCLLNNAKGSYSAGATLSYQTP